MKMKNFLGSQPGNSSLNFESSMSPGIADDELLFTSHKQRTMDVARTYNNNFEKNAGHSADTRDDKTLFKSERRFVCFDTLTIQTYRSLNARAVPSSACRPEPPLRLKRNVFLTQKDLSENMQEKEQSKIYPSSIDSSVSSEEILRESRVDSNPLIMNNETQLEDQSQEQSESRVMVTSTCSSWSSTSGSVPICTQNSLSSLINESLLAQKVSELSISKVEGGNESSCTLKESSASPFGKSSFHNLVARSPAGPSMFTVSCNKTNVSYDEDLGDQPVDYSKKYVERNSLRQNNVFQEAEVNQSSKKEFSDKDKVDLFGDYVETDLDQPTDYSLRYAEDDTDEDEKQNSGYFPGSEQEDTIKTYCTEGTPYETPFNFSTATSMSDLCLEDSKDSDLSKKVPKKISEVKDKVEVPFKPVEQRCQGPPTVVSRELKIRKNISELSSGLMSPEKPINYCEEGTPGCFSRVSSLSSLGSALVSQSNVASKIILEESPIKDEVISISRSDTRSARTSENRVPSATRETDGSPETKSDTRAIDKEGKMVTFGGEDYYAEQTPLMFSRCSSLGSLSGFEQHSIHDDRSSIISDFSRRTSGVVSPSELPDSPTQTVPPSPRHHKIQSTEFSARIQEEVTRPPLRHLSLNKVQPLKRSVFEDDIAAFKEESTPIELSAATSLSSLTIDDEPKITKDSKLRENVERYKTTKTIPEETERDAPGSVATSEVPEAEVDQDPVSDGDDDDEDILAACISMGMQNNRYRQPFKRPNLQKITVPQVTTNLVRYQTSSALNRLDASTVVPSEKASSPGLKPKSNVDVVVALDSVHIYCTEDTPAEISPVGSQSNLSALSMPSTPGEFTKIHLRESLQVEEQSLQLNELSDDSSNLSGDDEKILDECIQSGMPQIRQSTPPPTNCVSIANKPEALLQRYNLCGTPSPSPIESAHGSSKTAVHSEPLPPPPEENENVLSDDSSNLSEDEAILTECIQSAMRKGRLSPPSKKSSIAPKETEPQIDGANLHETSSPPSSLVLLEPTSISTAQTKSELSADGSSLSEDEDIILAQCIRSGMPKVGHTTRASSS